VGSVGEGVFRSGSPFRVEELIVGQLDEEGAGVAEELDAIVHIHAGGAGRGHEEARARRPAIGDGAVTVGGTQSFLLVHVPGNMRRKKEVRRDKDSLRKVGKGNY
jgi:hypothetical protein